ncbi:right-handed parallel beta-helix repeat-containing protein [Candidatus Poribacteria bacterium]|nr:right-handed parallel beta-helix repeat-containing protein [Candidatus Poribacteria bacterium]
MKIYFSFLLLINFLLFSGCKSDKVLPAGSIIKGTQIWEGTIYLKGDVTVAEGSKLIIKPGTKIIFPILDKDLSIEKQSEVGPLSPQAELIIYGDLEAKGTASQPIIFISEDYKNIKQGQWGSLNILGSEESHVEYCQFTGAYMGIHIHSSIVFIKNSSFINNYFGVRMKKSNEIDKPCMVSVENSKFNNNHIGISIRNAICKLDKNIFNKNEIGLWLKEDVIIKTSGNIITENAKGIFLTSASNIVISGNNIFNNTYYNVYLGEPQTESIDTPNNWWGTVDVEKIEKNNLDKKWDSSLGYINFIPFLHEPVKNGLQ